MSITTPIVQPALMFYDAEHDKFSYSRFKTKKLQLEATVGKEISPLKLGGMVHKPVKLEL